MDPQSQGVQAVVGSTMNFPRLMMSIFAYFHSLMLMVMNDSSLSPGERLIYGAALLIGFTIISGATFWFVIFLLRWVFRGIARLFDYLTEALSDPGSLIYIAVLSIIRSTPWYFNVLLVILFFSGCLSIIGGGLWTESFKYVLGATVGSLIGVVKKQEESDFDQGLFDAARSLSLQKTKEKMLQTPPVVDSKSQTSEDSGSGEHKQ